METDITKIVYNDPQQNNAFELIFWVRLNGVIAETIVAEGSLRDVPTPERLAQLKQRDAAFNAALG